MRDHLVFYINGVRQVVSAPDAFLSLSDYLRRRRELTGTKIVCSEGDCGACTVLMGRPLSAQSPIPDPQSEIQYLPVDSCIQFLFQLDGVHIVTVEGLRPDGSLNPVQQAMIECHGSQCGFCTPGFVMAMTGVLENCESGCRHDDATRNGAPHDDHAGGVLDEPAWRRSLTGNLCRCTGYTPILDAALQATQADHQRLGELYPAAPMLAELAATRDDALELRSETQLVACPRTLDDALAFLAANPDARIVAGATDVGVRTNKSGRLPPKILDLNRIDELAGVRIENGTFIAGARATWTSIRNACGLAAPEFGRILDIFGAPQIRHVGTIGGNIANGSPIADSLPFLYVTEATLVLANSTGRREVNINDFFRGYKQLDLKPGELIAEIRVPLSKPDETLRLYKVSRRKDLDISTFTAAIRLRLNADRIESASLAFGGVGPTVLRARTAEAFLVGKPFDEAILTQAADLAAAEVTPITDVRGEANYRRQLTKNILLKFYYQQLEPTLATL